MTAKRAAKSPQVGLRSRITTALLILFGGSLMLYPTTANWFSQYEQSQLIRDYNAVLTEDAKHERQTQRLTAEQYNSDLLSGGAVDLESGKLAEPGSEPYQRYEDILSARETGIMGRVIIPAIDVDQPIYHGTTDDVLSRNVGHLFGTALPLGGEGNRPVITAHSGLASARLFTDLPRLTEADLFEIEVLGERLTYQISLIEEVAPTDVSRVQPVAGKDLVTLVTCVPIGVNSERLLVTGERIPTPPGDDRPVPAPTELPRFPWWSLGLAVIIFLSAHYLLRGTLWPLTRKDQP